MPMVGNESCIDGSVLLQSIVADFQKPAFVDKRCAPAFVLVRNTVCLELFQTLARLELATLLVVVGFTMSDPAPLVRSSYPSTMSARGKSGSLLVLHAIIADCLIAISTQSSCN